MQNSAIYIGAGVISATLSYIIK